MENKLFKNAVDCFTVELEEGGHAIFDDVQDAVEYHNQCGVGDDIKTMKMLPIDDYLVIKKMIGIHCKEEDKKWKEMHEMEQRWIDAIHNEMISSETARHKLEEFEAGGREDWSLVRPVFRCIMEFEMDEEDFKEWERFTNEDMDKWVNWIRSNFGDIWGDVAKVISEVGY